LTDKIDNEIVPLHALIEGKESRAVLADMQLKPENLPKIFSTDPQAVKLGAKPGDVIKIKRRDYGNAYEIYRLVVEEQ
jgi:DNA-directed RNA polymerase subunit H (RpoH/RPB5)